MKLAPVMMWLSYGLTQAQRPDSRDAWIATTTHMLGRINVISLPFGCATIMTFNRSGISMALGLFIIPLLISRFPNLSFAALPASERLVEIKLQQAAVGVDVRKLGVVCEHSRWVASLLNRSETQNTLSLSNLVLGSVPTSLSVSAHGALCRLRSKLRNVPEAAVP